MALATHLPALLILLYCSNLLIHQVNSQVCGPGITLSSICFDLPAGSPCKQTNSCRARAEIKPFANGTEGIEVRLSGNVDTSTGPYVRLGLYRTFNDERYFNVYCQQGLAQSQILEALLISDILFISTQVSSDGVRFWCHFDIVPTVPLASRTATSFDPSNEHHLRLTTGNLNNVLDRATLVSPTTYRFRPGIEIPVPTTIGPSTTRGSGPAVTTANGNGPVRTTVEGDVPRTPGTGSDDESDLKPLASGATKSISAVWILVVVVILLVILAVGSIGYFYHVKKHKKSSRSRFVTPSPVASNETLITELWKGQSSRSSVSRK